MGFIEAATNVFSGDPKYMSMYSLDGPQGILPLRQFVVDKLKAHRGIDITVDEVLITSGSGQGIQIVNEVLLEEGDTVIVEEFSFSGALNFLRKRNVNFVAVKIDNDGIRMDHLEEVLQDLRGKGIQPKYIYTIPTLQNPNGSVMSMERRHRMLELSARIRRSQSSRTSATPTSFSKMSTSLRSRRSTIPTEWCTSARSPRISAPQCASATWSRPGRS